MSKTYYYFNDPKYPIQVSEDTLKITPSTFLESGEMWESESLKTFYNYIDNTKNYTIIDIGAQSGLYSLYAKYLPLSTFYSFEPFPETYKLLNENLLLNDINNVNTYNLGLSNKSGTTLLNTCISHNGLHTLGNNPLRFNDIKKIEININTIDNLFYDKNIDVNFIKIDTEGYEYYILQGGLKTIKKYKPLIQIEWNLTNLKQCEVDPDIFMNFINNTLEYKILIHHNEELIIASKN
jgi:FkbM family methyltransferase